MTGTRGERWPIKREIFIETYDVVESTGHTPVPDGILGDDWFCEDCGATSGDDTFRRGLDPCPGKKVN